MRSVISVSINEYDDDDDASSLILSRLDYDNTHLIYITPPLKLHNNGPRNINVFGIESPTPICLFTIQLHGAPMTI